MRQADGSVERPGQEKEKSTQYRRKDAIGLQRIKYSTLIQKGRKGRNGREAASELIRELDSGPWPFRDRDKTKHVSIQYTVEKHSGLGLE